MRAVSVNKRPWSAGTVAALLGVLLSSACATPPRPESLTEASKQASDESAEQVERWAPQASAKAAGLRKEAERAHETGNAPLADALAEHALAAFAHAKVLARLTKAKERLVNAKQQEAAIVQQLKALKETQQQVAARADALELEYKTVRDAEPLHPVEAADAKREAARRVAARSILEGARLLCLSARLLDGEAEVAPLKKQMDALEEQLQSSPRPTPIDEAVKLRSACLRALTDVRRETQTRSPAEDGADVLLSKVTRAVPEARSFRDDRGIVVPVGEPFSSDGKLTEKAQARLAELAQIAKANGAFPVLAVVHGPTHTAQAAQQSVEQWFETSPVKLTNLAVHDAQDRLPASVHPGRRQNSRIEFVLVAP